MHKIADVLLPIPIDQTFSYIIEENQECFIGQLVSVTFRTRQLIGVIITIHTQDSLNRNMKKVSNTLNIHIKPALIDFIDKVASYTITPRGLIFKMCINAGKINNNTSNKPITHNPTPLNITLNTEQQKAAKALIDSIGKKNTILLEGVTGSGKTEVYNYMIHHLISDGKQCLLLMPEILLATHITSRLKERFGFEAVEWHSNLSLKKKQENYDSIASGNAKLIIAARSGLFLPFPNLSAIIVDEEHDISYKQEEGVIYNGRDMAVLRGQLEGCPVILCSATPSIETIYNIELGKYNRIYLPSRFGIAKLPETTIIDMNKEKKQYGSFISSTMINTLKDIIKSGKQALLYINRRGYAPLTMCKECGHKIACPNCTAYLVEHKHKNLLQCHYCGYSTESTKQCVNCGAEDKITSYGPGVEKIEEEIKTAIPEARTSIFTSDHVLTKKDAENMISEITDRKIDIIIGTQMIAKGLHFPKLQFVGIIDGDAGMIGGDIRGIERTYQILQQVSGRAGRSEEGGIVMLQTYEPDSIMIKHLLSSGTDQFIKDELHDRELSWSPPFSRLVIVHLSSPNEMQLLECTQMLSKTAPYSKEIRVIGPAPSPIYLIRKRYRYRFVIKSDKNINVHKVIKKWIQEASIPPTIKVKIDVDPYNFL